MTRKRFQKLLISIGCPPKRAYTYKIFPITLTQAERVFAKDLLGYDCTTYQGQYDFIIYLTKMRPQWFEIMGWKKPVKKKSIFHWDRGRRASFTIDDAYVNEKILREYIYPQLKWSEISDKEEI